MPEGNDEASQSETFATVPKKTKKSCISRDKEKPPLLPASCKCTTDCEHVIEEDIYHQIHEGEWRMLKGSKHQVTRDRETMFISMC